jgi:hypothetical protein
VRNLTVAGGGSGSVPSRPPAIHLRLRTAPPGPPTFQSQRAYFSHGISLPPISFSVFFVAGFAGAPATTSRAPATFVRAGMCHKSPRPDVPDLRLEFTISVPIYLIPVMCFCMMLSTDVMLIKTDLYKLHFRSSPWMLERSGCRCCLDS